MFTVDNVKAVLEKEFIGKVVRYCYYEQVIWQIGLQYIKKTHSVTDKQFASGNPKYRAFKKKGVRLGTHKKYAESKIVTIHIDWMDECSLSEAFVIQAELENGRRIDLKY